MTRQTLFFDATLMLAHGFVSPVGMVRAEHYVAEYLARDPALAFKFVIYDREHSAYRSPVEHELTILEQILFHRYDSLPTTSPPASETDGTAVANEASPDILLVDSDSVGAADQIDIETPPPRSDASSPPPPRAGSHRHWSRLRAGLRLAVSLTGVEFDEVLSRLARRRLPIRPDQPLARRAAIRLLRRVALAGARGGHRGVLKAAIVRRRLADPAARLFRPDPAALLSAEPLPSPSTDPCPPPRQAMPDYDFPPFQPGDVLVSMANIWDYMDYGYLARLGLDDGVRIISVLYDVAGMELPFVTPAPAHLYHRHWVEIGHSSERIIGISRYSVESYERFIGRPNGLRVQMDCAQLPNFLRERAAEIGEAPVEELGGRNFVFYCSTIEVRKNHILLLHLWEELRRRIGPEKLPILVFVGKWGWSAESVRLVAERNWRLRPHMRVMDQVSDAALIWLYRNARFTVFPSLTEGFGLAAAESLSFGTPVVISNCPALQEATEQLMPAFHPHDFMGWLAEIERLILDDASLDSLRDKAKRFRGPAYDAFAAKIRDSALTPPATTERQTRAAPSESNAA